MSQPSLRTITVTDPICHTQEFGDWLELHGLNPGQVHTVHNVNGEYAIIHGYAHNASGRKYIDPESNQGAEFVPFAVRVKQVMPGGYQTATAEEIRFHEGVRREIRRLEDEAGRMAEFDGDDYHAVADRRECAGRLRKLIGDPPRDAR